MKSNRKIRNIKKDDHAGLGVYVFVMLGLSISLYLFGFTNSWDSYTQQASVGNTSINSSDISHTKGNDNVIILMIEFLTKNPAIMGLGLAGIVGLGVLSWFKIVDLSAFYIYLIPIGILAIFLNIFVFPISSLGEGAGTMSLGGIPVATLLLVFFNLWYAFAIIEFIRSGVTL